MSDTIKTDEKPVRVVKVGTENNPAITPELSKIQEALSDTTDQNALSVTMGTGSGRTKKSRKDIVRELPKTHVLKVASDTNVNKLAKTIVGCIKDFLKCELLCIGAGPTWVAVKAYMVAKGELAKYNYRLKFESGFIEPRPVIDGMERTGARVLLVAEEINP